LSIQVDPGSAATGNKAALGEYILNDRSDWLQATNGSNTVDMNVAISKTDSPLRNHIRAADVKHWSKHWKVTPEHIRAAIEKVGNSVGAVEKELNLQGLLGKD